MVTRRRFCQSVLSSAYSLSVLSSAMAATKKKPNIIFIMADDLGYGHLGCYGQEKIRTPNLDQMASEGMRFLQCYAGAPVCAPSRSILMTGLHGGHTPVRGNSGGIPLQDGDVTVAERLKAAGYNTALFGKWGLGEHGTEGVPYKQGFDEFFGWLHQIHAHFYYPEYLWRNDEKYELQGNDGFSGQYAHDVIVGKAMDYIRQQAKQENPFFLYLPLAIPHYELLVPEESLNEYKGKFPEEPYTGRREKVGYPHDYAAQETPKAAIAAMITHMDRNIGRIFDLLKEQNLDEDTLVIFTSDNGPSYGPGSPEFFKASGGLRGLKTSLYEGGIRVPMIARWPGKIEAGSVVNHPCYFPDIMPTLTELADGEAPHYIDGISILPTLLGQSSEQKEHEVMYWEMNDARALRMGEWKAVLKLRNGGDIELYNLKSDPIEQHDVSITHPDIAEKMKRLIEREHVNARPQIEPPKPPDRQYQ